MDLTIKQRIIQLALKKYHYVSYCDKQIQEDIKPFFLIKRKLNVSDVTKLDKGFILNNIILLSNVFGIECVIEIFDIVLNSDNHIKGSYENEDRIRILNSFIYFLFNLKIEGDGMDTEIYDCLSESVLYKRYLKRDKVVESKIELTNILYSQEMQKKGFD